MALGLGAVANVLSRTGAPLCRPDSLLQGHALWHVLTAVGAALWLACWSKPGGDAVGRDPADQASEGARPAGRTPP